MFRCRKSNFNIFLQTRLHFLQRKFEKPWYLRKTPLKHPSDQYEDLTSLLQDSLPQLYFVFTNPFHNIGFFLYPLKTENKRLLCIQWVFLFYSYALKPYTRQKNFDYCILKYFNVERISHIVLVSLLLT